MPCSATCLIIILAPPQGHRQRSSGTRVNTRHIPPSRTFFTSLARRGESGKTDGAKKRHLFVSEDIVLNLATQPPFPNLTKPEFCRVVLGSFSLPVLPTRASAHRISFQLSPANQMRRGWARPSSSHAFYHLPIAQRGVAWEQGARPRPVERGCVRSVLLCSGTL